MSSSARKKNPSPREDREGQVSSRRDYLVSSVRVLCGVRHDIITVWARGGNAGELVVDRGDGERIARLLLPLDAFETGALVTIRRERGDISPGSGLDEILIEVSP